ncbi:hypothetical protein [Bartonella vinsonii]|nr:hypothetical protein [Bartonella vinsonii]
MQQHAKQIKSGLESTPPKGKIPKPPRAAALCQTLISSKIREEKPKYAMKINPIQAEDITNDSTLINDVTL